MKLRPGQKLHSAVCDGQVVVVKAPATEVDVRFELDAALGEGPLLGKRYADEDLGLELLCTRAGTGALTVDGRPLVVKGAKPLPSSD